MGKWQAAIHVPWISRSLTGVATARKAVQISPVTIALNVIPWKTGFSFMSSFVLFVVRFPPEGVQASCEKALSFCQRTGKAIDPIGGTGMILLANPDSHFPAPESIYIMGDAGLKTQDAEYSLSSAIQCLESCVLNLESCV
jgi:hypothetical protein